MLELPIFREVELDRVKQSKPGQLQEIIFAI